LAASLNILCMFVTLAVFQPLMSPSSRALQKMLKTTHVKKESNSRNEGFKRHVVRGSRLINESGSERRFRVYREAPGFRPGPVTQIGQVVCVHARGRGVKANMGLRTLTC
jgi:hypothetical protein